MAEKRFSSLPAPAGVWAFTLRRCEVGPASIRGLAAGRRSLILSISRSFPHKIKCRCHDRSGTSEKRVQQFGVSNKATTGFPDILGGMATAPADGDLLAPVPLAGVLVGYGRVSTREQNLARQYPARVADDGPLRRAAGHDPDARGLTWHAARCCVGRTARRKRPGQTGPAPASTEPWRRPTRCRGSCTATLTSHNAEEPAFAQRLLIWRWHGAITAAGTAGLRGPLKVRAGRSLRPRWRVRRGLLFRAVDAAMMVL